MRDRLDNNGFTMEVSDYDRTKETDNSYQMKNNNWILSDYGQTKETHNDDNSKDNEGVAKVLLQKLVDFSDNVSMHGIGLISRKKTHFIVRIFWLLIVLAGVGYCLYVFQNTVESFLAYPISTKISTKIESKSMFPAITLCNMNVFQRSRITSAEADAIRETYGPYPLAGTSNINLADFDYINVTELTFRGAYDYTGPAGAPLCAYKSTPCNTSLFSLVLTDHGICIKFDPSTGGSAAFQTTAGFGAGLYIASLFEPLDWTVGPYYHTAGFRIKLHEPGTTIYKLADNGISLTPGAETTILVERTVTANQAPPYGECGSAALAYFPTYSRRNCFLECQTNHWVALCGCKNAYMPGPASVCTFKQHFDCVQLQANTTNEVLLFDASLCDCPQDCTQTDFSSSVRTTQFASGYALAINTTMGVDIREKGLAVTVFYPSLQYTEEIQERLYSVESLLSDIGGAAGLFLGCSLISIVEVLYFIGESIWYLLARCFGSKKTS